MPISFTSTEDPNYISAYKKIDDTSSRNNYIICALSLLVIGGGMALIATHLNDLRMAAVGAGVAVVGGIGGLYGKHRVTWIQEEEKKALLAKIRPQTIHSEPTSPRTQTLKPEDLQPNVTFQNKYPSLKQTDSTIQSEPVQVLPLTTKEVSVIDLPREFSALNDLKPLESLMKDHKVEFLNFVSKNNSYKNLKVAEALSKYLTSDELVQFFKDHFVEICNQKIDQPTIRQIVMLHMMHDSVYAKDHIEEFALSMGINIKDVSIIGEIGNKPNYQTIEVMEMLANFKKVSEFCQFAQLVILDVNLENKQLTNQQKVLLKEMIQSRLSQNLIDTEKDDLEYFKNNYLDVQ